MPFLDWVKKTQAVRNAASVPYHLLQFAQGYGEPETDTMLIQGDNLLGLESLVAVLPGPGEVHLRRPAIQHRTSFP
jgi:hypothetical protein